MTKAKPKYAISDEELFSDLLSGDMGAFDIIVDRYKERLLNFVFRFLGDHQAAEDIVQETFLRVYRERRKYCSIANLSTWMFTIAGNLAKSELRRRKRWRFISLDWEGDQGGGIKIANGSPGPDELAEERIMERHVQKAIDSLPPKYREVVILRDIEGLSYEEIAQIIRCPVGTVKSRVNRGRIQLQKKLRDIVEDMRQANEL